MRGHIRKRGRASFEYIVDVGTAPAQRCQGCNKRFWVERKPRESCPACGGELRETEERRRAIKAGFASRKEAQAAMAKVLVAVEEQKLRRAEQADGARVPHQGVAAGHRSRRCARRPTAPTCSTSSFHIVPHIGSLQLQKVSAAPR